MSFLSRILPAPAPRLEEAIATLAKAQRVEPITLNDRRVQIRDAMTGATGAEQMHLAVYAMRLLDRRAMSALVREMDRQIWKAQKP